jgi:bacillopeptidase F (M6 metalloprotease family)
MKTHYILFCVDGYNGPEKDARLVLRAFEESLSAEGISESTKKLGPHSWLIDRSKDIALLAKIVNRAEADHLKYSILFLSSHLEKAAEPGARANATTRHAGC